MLFERSGLGDRAGLVDPTAGLMTVRVSFVSVPLVARLRRARRRPDRHVERRAQDDPAVLVGPTRTVFVLGNYGSIVGEPIPLARFWIP